MKLHLLAPLTFFLLLLTAGPAFADTLVNDYPINGSNDGLTITGFSVSDQFTLSSAATITGVNFGAWLFPGYPLTSVAWTISSGAVALGTPGTTYGTATASTSLDTTFTPYTNIYSYTVASETFSTGSLDLAAGTYYLTLEDAVTNGGAAAYWDMNNVTDEAYDSGITGDLASNCNSGYGLNNDGGSYTGNCAEAFQILGTATSTSAPEPNTLALLGGGLFVLGCFRKRLLQSPVS